MFTIGHLAKRALVSADAIRLYERQGLISAAGKTNSGYRLYGDGALRRLEFIRHAQRCGFSLAEIREVLRTQDGEGGTDADSYRFALEKKAEVDERIASLRAMSEALSGFIAVHEGRSVMPNRTGIGAISLLHSLQTMIGRGQSAERVTE